MLKLLFVLVILALGTCLLTPRADHKLTPAEVVARHLESVGTAEARSQVRSIKTTCTCILTVRQGGNGQAGGQAVMASKGSQNLINMTFDSPEYPYENLRFDGKNFTASQFKPGLRTSLAQFFLTHEILFKEGLVGGVLSTAWPLLDLQQKNPKLEYAGIKKIQGKAMHALRYAPRKSSDLKIILFFDLETFQHLRTEYEQTIYTMDQQRIGGGGGRPPAPGEPRSSNARISAFEEFSDFKIESGLNLPHSYKFELSIQSEVRPALVNWLFTLTEFSFNSDNDFN
jgi:hypothetical protein